MQPLSHEIGSLERGNSGAGYNFITIGSEMDLGWGLGVLADTKTSLFLAISGFCAFRLLQVLK